MVRVIRPLMVFCGAGALSVLGYQLAGGALGSGTPGTVLASTPLGGFAGLGRGYDLGELELLHTTLYHVTEKYVEPERIDFERMYTAALTAVERFVPVCRFEREPGARTVRVEVGDHTEDVPVPVLKTSSDLHAALSAVAQVLAANLDPDDVPVHDRDAVPLAEVEYVLINGVLSTLDPHSTLLPPEDSRQMDVENEGEFGGLGITIIDPKGQLTVEYPLADTPAERAGLQPNDQIVRIDGESTINMSLADAVSRLRGKIGAKVTIHIKREGVSEPFPVTIERARIKVNAVTGQVLDGGVGYVAIKSFHAAVDADLATTLARLTAQTGGLEGLVLDLRSNPGGYLKQAVAVADRFLDEGVIVTTVDGKGEEDDRNEATSSGTEPGYPIAVLMNASSASASEIVAGALRNNERAVILGERSFGKGSVQTLHEYRDQSKLKLTMAKYLTPGNRSIQSVGIPADIQLVPSIVEHRVDEPSGRDEDLIRMYWRERVKREADLDLHLDDVHSRADAGSFYTLRYLRPYDLGPRGPQPDLAKDFEVQFAREVLLAASSGRRADILAEVGPVKERFARQHAEKIDEAFAALGIDWAEGTPARTADLEVSLDLGEDGVLRAGQEEDVGLVVKNVGTRSVYRLAAVATDHDLLGGHEWFFGRIDPGQTRRFTQHIQPPNGYPTEALPVSIAFRDSGADWDAHVASGGREARGPLLTLTPLVPVQGNARPQLAWTWRLHDTSGDGVVSLGEPARIELIVENVGEGPTVEATARIRNESGKALDIVRGTLMPGFLVAEDGGVCPAPVVDDAVPAGCKRTLAPGQRWSGNFEVVPRRSPDGEYALTLSVSDAGAYDYATIVRSGWSDYFEQEERLQFEPGRRAPAGHGPTVSGVDADWSRPPKIEITRAPSSDTTERRVSVAGRVLDDSGLSNVQVFHGEGKELFLASSRSAPKKAIAFEDTIDLDLGPNVLSVLATDIDGLTHSWSVVVRRSEPVMTAAGSTPPESVTPLE